MFVQPVPEHQLVCQREPPRLHRVRGAKVVVLSHCVVMIRDLFFSSTINNQLRGSDSGCINQIKLALALGPGASSRGGIVAAVLASRDIVEVPFRPQS